MCLVKKLIFWECFRNYLIKKIKMEINVSDSENLWQVEFYSHGNVRFSSFKHENKNRGNYV